MNNTEIDAAARQRLQRQAMLELDRSGRDGFDLGLVLTEAGVSPAEFEAAYASVDECLFAAYEELTAELDGAVRDACRDAGEAEWPDKVRAGLEALLAELARDPRLARVLTRRFPALGPRAQARSLAFVESFGPLLAPGRELSESGAELPREIEVLAAGAVEAIIVEAVAAGRAAELPDMAPALLFSLLVPFLGPARATTEMTRTAPEKPA